MHTLIVADDLTGALDVAGPFAQCGVDTAVVVDPARDWSADLARARVVSINADSRHLPAEQAAARIAQVLKGVDTGGRVLLKKIDSTLRGQVVAETLAMLRATGRLTAVVAPAFPAQGRTVRAGVVLVNGVPLPETSFAKDALSPPPLKPLHFEFMLADERVETHCVADLADAPLEAFSEQVVVLDADTDAELMTAVQHADDLIDQLLWVGAAGIAQALAAHLYGASATWREPPRVTGRILFVVGTRAQATRDQVAQLSVAHGVELIEAPNGAVDIERALRSTAPVLVLRAAPGPAGEGDAAVVAASLGAAADRLLREGGFDAVVASGGDTARAFLSATAVAALRVMGDLMPGIPYSRFSHSGRDVWLVTKAGGFGRSGAFETLVARLRGGG